LSVAAYSYEFLNIPLVSDAEFDAMSLEVDTSVDTGNETLDKFFRDTFSPETGMWVHSHPELDKLARLTATRVKAKTRKIKK